jgi:hypothetical protein
MKRLVFLIAFVPSAALAHSGAEGHIHAAPEVLLLAALVAALAVLRSR